MLINLFRRARELEVTDDPQWMHLVVQRLAKEKLHDDYRHERKRAGKQIIDLCVFRSSLINQVSNSFVFISAMEYSASLFGELSKFFIRHALHSPCNLLIHFANLQRRNTAYLTGAGVAYPEGLTTIPNKSLELRSGLKSIEGLQRLVAFGMVLGIVHRV